MRLSTLFLGIALLLFNYSPTQAQNINENQYNALEYRLIGPFRGGRSAAVTGGYPTAGSGSPAAELIGTAHLYHYHHRRLCHHTDKNNII